MRRTFRDYYALRERQRQNECRQTENGMLKEYSVSFGGRLCTRCRRFQGVVLKRGEWLCLRCQFA